MQLVLELNELLVFLAVLFFFGNKLVSLLQENWLVRFTKEMLRSYRFQKQEEWTL